MKVQPKLLGPALLAVAVAAAIIAAACQRDATSSPDLFAANLWTLSEREARIGSVDDPDYIFGAVLGMALGPDGLLYTTHRRESSIRRWTADGAPAGSLGRKGEGPGEFEQLPSGLGFFGDSLWVWDHYARRVSYFDLERKFLGSVSLRVDPGSMWGSLPQSVPLRDGTFIVIGRHVVRSDRARTADGNAVCAHGCGRPHFGPGLGTAPGATRCLLDPDRSGRVRARPALRGQLPVGIRPAWPARR